MWLSISIGGFLHWLSRLCLGRSLRVERPFLLDELPTDLNSKLPVRIKKRLMRSFGSKADLMVPNANVRLLLKKLDKSVF